MKCIVEISALLLWSGLAWCTPRQRADPFSEQVARLVTRIKMPEEELAAVPIIMQDLELALGTHWPGSQIEIFGSIVTGLALVGSDIDAYVLLPDRSVRPHGPINYEAAAVLKQFPDYADIHPTFFYVPFLHVPSQKKIDLLFNNIEGGRNSALLSYLLNLDDCVKNLAIIVKYWWAKVQKQAESKMVPSYGMSVMLVFYLQHVNMLPPVAMLQEHAKPFIYEGWNSGFNQIDYKTHNNASLYQLLGGFFKFYNDFNYDEYIISPFVGHPVKRELFKDLKNIPREFKCYRRNIAKYIEMPVNLTNEVLVQDLILHNKNLAVLLVSRENSPFQAEFKRLAFKYRENNKKRQVIQFGSTVNGLAMVGSDVDFIALLNNTDDADSVVEQAIEVFQQYPLLFTDFDTFPGSIEFVSFQHIPTGCFVDVIFNDLDGVRNTELIKYLIHLDERVYEFVMIVKYWAKIHELTRDRVLSNYAMTLLVMFYFQQKGILPSIAWLQNGAEPYILKGWNTGFDKKEYEPHFDDSFYHLLGGFFEYYNSFDFDKNIISIFAGFPIKRKLFENLRDVPDEYDLYKKNIGQGISRALILKRTQIIIQDPFTHFVNLAKHLNWRPFAAFRAQMKSSALKYQENNESSVFLDEILSDR